MHNYSRHANRFSGQEQVKVAVCTAKLAADQAEQQQFQEILLVFAAIATALFAFLTLG
ncbi:MAG: hypothetical protein AAFW75_32055 [Cyanobacteria bacterium J06636_16]